MGLVTSSGAAAVRHFLAPASIAVVGASTDETSVSGRPLTLLRQHGYPGPVYPVNPRHATVGGLPCFASVRDIPAPVDLALICVPAARVPAVIAECGEAGVPAAYVITSGFNEALQADAGTAADHGLRAALAGHATRVSGPNAEGIYNIIDDVALGFSPTVDYDRGLRSRPRPGNVAIVAQSGGLGFGIMNQGLARGVDFSYVVSTGNETDLGVLEYVEYLLEDEHTTVVGLFLEGVDKPLALRDLGLRAAAAGKAIVVAKVGRSPEGQRAAVSHTGHVTGPSHLWSALFRQAGIVEVTDISEFLDVLAVLARFRSAPGRRVAVITGSGGAGTWMTDALRDLDLEVPELPGDLQQELAALLPYYAGTRNPVDMTAGGAGPAAQARVLSLVGGSPDIDVVVAISSLLNPETAKEAAVRFADGAQEIGKPLICYSYTQPAEGVADAFAERGIPVVLSQAGVARAIRALAELGQRSPTLPVPPPVSIPALPGARGAAAVLPEAQVKAWLAAAGLPVPRSELVGSAADAVAASAAIGYPVVVKVQAAALPHKGDAGVLALRLGSAPEVRAAYDEVWARAVTLIGADGIAGVLVEQMVPAGFEMLVGITRDPALGPFLTVGAGGSLTEIFHDVVALPAPASPEQVRAAVFRLRCGGAFDPGAGAPLDLAAFCELAATISAIAAQTPELAELDLNPVIVHQAGGGADIADALAVRT
jgi:acetate---CoA ligase (ADP-forming)